MVNLLKTIVILITRHSRATGGKKLLQISLFLYFFSSVWANAQQLVYSNICNCGVTANGGSAAFGSGTLNLPVQIPSNSTIKKAYLIAARDSLADDFTITLNGINYTFTSNSIVTNEFLAYNDIGFIRPNSGMHIMDITNDINPSITNYSLVIPPHPNPLKGSYMLFYLYIVFENPLLSKTALNLYLNKYDVSPFISYNLSNMNKINNLNPVCLAIVNTYACDTIQDGSYVAVNANTIGLIGGEELNSPFTCIGAWANFAHYNDSLFGLDDDTPDNLMGGTDALADIKSYVNNRDTAVNVTFTYQTPSWQNGRLTNPIRAVMLSYSTPCDTFTTTATTNQDTICQGDSIQLAATGGATYSWFSAFSTFNDSTLANPLATPSQTTTYIVSIKNDSGCVKTEHVKVWVNPTPKPDTITVTPQICGNTDGSIVVGNIPNGTAPFNYTLTNLQTLTSSTQTSNVFSQLSTSGFQLLTQDANGCVWQSDTIFVPEINNASANFNLYTIPYIFPEPNPLGAAPLTVYTQNASVNVNSYEWWVMSNELGVRDTITQYSSLNTQHTFEEGGTYDICLFSYNNLPQCGDTACKTIIIDSVVTIIDDSLVLIIPNVFTPNNDGNNDNFVIEIQSANLLEKLEVEIFNRWGQLVSSSRFNVQGLASAVANSPSGLEDFTIWDGTTTTGTKVPEGTYFYVVTYIKIPASAGMTGETKTEKGTITLLR